MKRNLLLAVICASVLTLPVQAQETSLMQPSGITISAGYGFPSLAKKVFDFAEGNNVNSSFFGPAYVKAEIPLSDHVGFGLNFAYSHGNATYVTQDGEIDSIFYNTQFDYTSYSVLARLNFHFGQEGGMFDPYAGFGMGYRNANYAYTGGDPDAEPYDINGLIHLGAELTIGTRIYLTDNIGIYGEVGFAKSPFQAGLVVKF